MAKARTLAGLDVHAAKIVAAILESETGELRFRALGGESGAVVELCRSLPAPVRTTYEAGPTGFGLARALLEAGVDCLVAAPGKIPRGATDKVKTDRRDAEHLVRLLLAGRLHAVRVPGSEEEAFRDLIRAREDVRGDLMRARHRIGKLLLRRGLRFKGTAWSGAHERWLDQITLEEGAAQATFDDYRLAMRLACQRRASLEAEIEERIEGSPWQGEVARLRCLRGIDTLTAAGLCAEIGDFERFARPAQLMSYLGLVPSESSSGLSRRQGAITRSGSRHARRLMVEAAWHYRREPRMSGALMSRQAGQPAEAIQISWAAQRRLHRVWRSMEARSKRRTLVAVAIARQLSGFCWAVVRT